MNLRQMLGCGTHVQQPILARRDGSDVLSGTLIAIGKTGAVLGEALGIKVTPPTKQVLILMVNAPELVCCLLDLIGRFDWSPAQTTRSVGSGVYQYAAMSVGIPLGQLLYFFASHQRTTKYCNT